MKTTWSLGELTALALAIGSDGFRRGSSMANNLNFQRCLVLGLAILGLLLSGCATRGGVKAKSPADSGFEETRVSAFGTIALAGESTAASFSFQRAKGKLGTAKQAIWDSTEMGLSGPGAGVIVAGTILTEMKRGGDPQGAIAVAGLAGGATAIGAALVGPVVGTKDLIRSFKSVSPIELAEREAALTNALRQMAGQQPFRDALLKAGAERIRGGFLLSEPTDPPEEPATEFADSVLEARVDDLRLERAGSSEGSYFLRIKTHARLVRVVNGSVCFEEHAEYRSGTALFLDWTLHGAIQAVAETGYRALAQHYVAQFVADSQKERAR